MPNGILKIYLQRESHGPWQLLEAMSYDDASRRRKNRFAGVYDIAKNRVFGFRENYWQFFHASFCIENQEDQFSQPVHLFGPKRIKPKKMGGGLPRKPSPYKAVPPSEPRSYPGGLKRKPLIRHVEVEIPKPRKQAAKPVKMTKDAKAAAKRHMKAQARRWKKETKSK